MAKPCLCGQTSTATAFWIRIIIMKTKYKINYDWKVDVIIEIDDEIMTNKALTEINTFWSNHDRRLNDADGIVLNAVLKLLTGVVLSLKVEYGYNTTGIVSLFDWNENGGSIEGWPEMNGSKGIEIIRVDDFEFDPDDMTVGLA